MQEPRATGRCDDRPVPAPTLTALATAVLLVPRPPERVLEIRCGEGDGVLFLAREFPSARVRGVDPTAENVHRATARIGLDPEGRVAFKQSSSKVPYPDEHFDLVCQSRGRVRPTEVARLLRPGGILIVVGALGRVLEWRLRGRGFEDFRAGEAEGVTFHLARLG